MPDMERTPINPSEVSSIYVDNEDRYIVSLIVGYKGVEQENGTGLSGPREAAWYALDLTQDQGWNGTTWFVYDRKTGETHLYEQDEFAEYTEDGSFRFVPPMHAIVTRAGSPIIASALCADCYEDEDERMRTWIAVQNPEDPSERPYGAWQTFSGPEFVCVGEECA